MFPSTAGRVVGEGGRADGASAGRADGASAGSSIPEGVSTGPPDLRQFLMAARTGDDRALSRGEKQAPNDVVRASSRDVRTVRAASRAWRMSGGPVETPSGIDDPAEAPPARPAEAASAMPPPCPLALPAVERNIAAVSYERLDCRIWTAVARSN